MHKPGLAEAGPCTAAPVPAGDVQQQQHGEYEHKCTLVCARACARLIGVGWSGTGWSDIPSPSPHVSPQPHRVVHASEKLVAVCDTQLHLLLGCMTLIC